MIIYLQGAETSQKALIRPESLRQQRVEGGSSTHKRSRFFEPTVSQLGKEGGISLISSKGLPESAPAIRRDALGKPQTDSYIPARSGGAPEQAGSAPLSPCTSNSAGSGMRLVTSNPSSLHQPGITPIA